MRLTAVMIWLVLAAPVSGAAGRGGGGGQAAVPRPWADLAPAPEDAGAQLALALYEAGAGRARRAHAMLAELAGRDVGEELGARIATEEARVARWLALRAEFLDLVIASGKKIGFQLGGKRLLTTIRARRGDVLELGENRRGLETLSLEAVPSGQLAKLLARGTPAQKGSWVRAFGYVLAGDERWRKTMHEESEEAERFRRDAVEVYPDLLREARVAAELRALSTIDAPASGTEADALLARIRDLRERHAGRRLVAERKAALSLLTRAAYGAKFASLSLDEVLHGKIEPMEGSRIRMTYDFETPEQRGDFEVLPDYLPSLRESAGHVSPDIEPAFEIVDGALRGLGSFCLRHPLVLGAPLDVSYELEYRERPNCKGMATRFMLGFLDDGRGSFAGCIDFGNLMVRDVPSHFEHSAFDPAGFTYFFDTRYPVSVHQNEEGTMTSTADGEERMLLHAGPRREGGTLLWFHTQCFLLVHQVVIEGELTPRSSSALRERWIDARLRELGLD